MILLWEIAIHMDFVLTGTVQLTWTLLQGNYNQLWDIWSFSCYPWHFGSVVLLPSDFCDQIRNRFDLCSQCLFQHYKSRPIFFCWIWQMSKPLNPSRMMLLLQLKPTLWILSKDCGLENRIIHKEDKYRSGSTFNIHLLIYTIA